MSSISSLCSFDFVVLFENWKAILLFFVFGVFLFYVHCLVAEKCWRQRKREEREILDLVFDVGVLMNRFFFSFFLFFVLFEHLLVA